MYSLNFTYLYPEDSFNFEEVEVGWWSKILLSSSGYWTVNSYNLAFFWVLATFTYKLESFDFEEEEKEVGWWPQFLLSSSPCQTVILYIFFLKIRPNQKYLLNLTHLYKFESFDFEEEEEVGWWPQFLLSSSACHL